MKASATSRRSSRAHNTFIACSTSGNGVWGFQLRAQQTPSCLDLNAPNIQRYNGTVDAPEHARTSQPCANCLAPLATTHVGACKRTGHTMKTPLHEPPDYEEGLVGGRGLDCSQDSSSGHVFRIVFQIARPQAARAHPATIGCLREARLSRRPSSVCCCILSVRTGRSNGMMGRGGTVVERSATESQRQVQRRDLAI